MAYITRGVLLNDPTKGGSEGRGRGDAAAGEETAAER
jgi:hypothetical protein